MAQWLEMVEDPEQKIYRPRQVFVGSERRDYLPVSERGRARAERTAVATA